jgi:hypothetical protein
MIDRNPGWQPIPMCRLSKLRELNAPDFSHLQLKAPTTDKVVWLPIASGKRIKNAKRFRSIPEQPNSGISATQNHLLLETFPATKSR